MYKILVFITGFLLLAGIICAQEIKTHANLFVLNYLQIKEEANYGLVFKGPGIGYAYAASWENEKRVLCYEGRLNLDVPVTRNIIAASVNLVPARFDYLFKTGDDRKLQIGPYAVIEYNYELYPDLQSGYSYWFSHFSLGGAAVYSFDVKKNRFELAFHTTLLGFTSRQPVYDDPYFFDLGFGDIVKFVNQDLQFGSWNTYNQSKLELRWQPNAESRLVYGYSFQYYGYYTTPRLSLLNQSLKLIILPKKNK